MRPLQFLLSIAVSSSGFALETTPKEWDAPNGIHIPYRLAVPEKSEEGKVYPLVLFLHGAGERGDDNTKHLKHGIRSILTGAEKLNEPCFLIAPQCPAELWWANLDEQKLRLKDAAGPNPRLEAVLALVAEFSKTHPVDPKRFYVTGISMGGFGTWDLLGRVPEKIAAALPICGGGDPSIASRYKDVPIWAFHGGADPTVPVAATTDMVAALEKAGGTPKMTIYPGVKHDSWTKTYDNPETIRWLFSQKQK